MPNPDGTIQSRSLADKVITSELLDDDIQSDNFSSGSAGWKIERDTGNAEFNDVAVRGTIEAASIEGNMTLGTGGVLRTASSGERIEIAESSKDRISFYTGDNFEALPALIRHSVIGIDGTTRQLGVVLFAPTTTGDTNAVQIILRSESENDSSLPPQVFVGYGGGSSQIPEFKLTNDFKLMLEDGTEALPSLTFNNATTDGLYSAADGIGVVVGADEIVRYTATRANFDIGALAAIRIPSKADSGDPSGGVNGDFYLNLADNAGRMFADGSWRTVFSY